MAIEAVLLFKIPSKECDDEEVLAEDCAGEWSIMFKSQPPNSSD